MATPVEKFVTGKVSLLQELHQLVLLQSTEYETEPQLMGHIFAQQEYDTPYASSDMGKIAIPTPNIPIISFFIAKPPFFICANEKTAKISKGGWRLQTIIEK